MFIRFMIKPLWNLDAEGAGGNVDTTGADAAKGAADKAPAAEAAKGTTGGDAPAETGGKGADTTIDRDGIGGNSGKTKAEVAADLALSDEMKSRLLSGLPTEAQKRASEWLKTRSSLPDLLKAGLGADSKISELSAQLKGMVKLPGKDAKPEEIAAFRKAAGVPESAEKYAVYRPEGYEPTEFDQEAEKTYLETMHSVHAPQAVVDAGLKAFYTIQAQTAKAQADRAKAAGEAAIEDLRVEYGRDYKANIALADRWLQEHLGQDMGEDWKGLMGLRFADGTALGEKPGFVKAIVKLAKAWADDGPVDIGTSGSEMNIDTEIATMMGKMGTPEYNSPAFQQKLDGLIALRNKRSARAA